MLENGFNQEYMNKRLPDVGYRMYILVKETVPLGHQVNGVAHAAYACAKQFGNDTRCIEWERTSFRKITLSVSEETFEFAKSLSDRVVMTESSLKDDNGNPIETVICFCPRLKEDYPKKFRYLKLFGS